MNRRQFLQTSALLSLTGSGCLKNEHYSSPPVFVNDVHSKLNRTRVEKIEAVESVEQVQNVIRIAAKNRKSLSVAGGRHAMGAQQFGTDSVLIDTTRLRRVLDLDSRNGVVEVEAGVQWPELVQSLFTKQPRDETGWGIIQKQTGGDRLSIGGCLSANAHGRGLQMKPFIADVESFTLLDAEGNLHTCSRTQNRDLFNLAIGGYGLFGFIYSVKLRLNRRHQIQRIVEVKQIEDLIPSFAARIGEGYTFGDFQYSIDENSDDFLRKGIFSCYKPVLSVTPAATDQRQLSAENWKKLLYLAHTDRRQVFEEYAKYYLSTSGQIYWSDTHQLSTYIDDYHQGLDSNLPEPMRGTEMITELYVPREQLVGFMRDAAKMLRESDARVIYGTIRLIEKDEESFLAWAREPFACVIFNLHVNHAPAGVERAVNALRQLIDLASARRGSYFLTYHKYAKREQVERCYPQFSKFLELKRKYDPQERFSSDWYRHHKALFA